MKKIHLRQAHLDPELKKKSYHQLILSELHEWTCPFEIETDIHIQ